MDGLNQLRNALSGRYTIERELGSGGMATVYLARDERHDRQVAIKVLHEDLGATLGAERFLAEIKTTARLQHPHILPLLDSGAAGGLLYYVMPVVEGETLRTRLTRDTQLPIEDAVRIAREVADALGYAHGHGIVHRDVKPENILLQGGHALVADFGIALAVQQAGGTRLTQTGLSLGTPQYMSPEQAMGEKTVGPAADIYALGAVTYEMLTGEPPFSGATVQAIVAKVLSSEPERPTTLRKTVPFHVEVSVLKALAKIPADRFPSAAQFAEALVRPMAETANAVGADHRGRPVVTTGRTARWWPGVAAVTSLVAILTSVVALRATREARLALPLKQYDVVLPDSAPISFTKGSPWGAGWTALAVSPRADFVVYIADRGTRTELWYRSLLDSVARPLAGTEGAYQLAMSPDGTEVAFIAGSRLRLVPVAGGRVRELGQVQRSFGMTWASPDRLLVADDGIKEFDRLGGTPIQRAAQICPTPYAVSRTLLLCGDARAMRILDLEGKGADLLRVRDGKGTYSPFALAASMPVLVARNLVFSASDGSVIASRWHQDDRSVDSRAVVLSGVRTEGQANSRQAVVASSGTLVFVPGIHNARAQFVRASGHGEPVPLPIEPTLAEQFDISSDGRKLAAAVHTPDGMEVWVYDMTSGRGTRWISAHWLIQPLWSPDGRKLAVQAFRDAGDRVGVTVIGSPASGAPPDTLQGSTISPSHWYEDARMLGTLADAVVDLGNAVVDLQLGTSAVDTIVRGAGVNRAVLSRDRRFVAFMQADQIVVNGFRGERVHTVVGRGLDPLWLDDRTVVYKDGWQWYRVRIRADGSMDSSPQAWFSDSLFVDTNFRSYATTSTGEVVYLRSVAKQSATLLRVIPGWDKAVSRAVKTAR